MRDPSSSQSSGPVHASEWDLRARQARKAERRRLERELVSLRNRWQWWATEVREYAVHNLEQIGAEVAAISAALDELDRLDAEAKGRK